MNTRSKTKQTSAYITCGLLLAGHAFAQTAIDPATSMKSLQTWGLGILGSALALMCLWKGGHAYAEGRSLGPAIIGFVGAIALGFGGPYILQRAGITGLI